MFYFVLYYVYDVIVK